VEGLCARGGFEVNIVWNDGKLKEAVLRSINQTEKTVSVKYGGVETVLTFKPLETIRLNEKFYNNK
jgi:alpha-L-fucosidase 2